MGNWLAEPLASQERDIVISIIDVLNFTNMLEHE
jgi:hypothetical protein